MVIKFLFSLDFHLVCLIIIVPAVYPYQVSPSKGHQEPLVAWRQELLFTFLQMDKQSQKENML